MTDEADYLELAREIKALVRPHGFALLMQLDDGQFHYASNADRADVCKTFREWLARVGVVNARDPGEPAQAAKGRLRLEARCAELGHVLEACGHKLLLVVFNFGEGGDLAWYTNVTGTRELVEGFLKTAEAAS